MLKILNLFKYSFNDGIENSHYFSKFQGYGVHIYVMFKRRY